MRCDPGKDVALALAARKRLLLADSGGHRPEVLRELLGEMFRRSLAEHARRCGIDERPAALIAVGALGRGELLPHSDLDLVLIHRRGTEVGELAERLWYPLWNSGTELDHAVRTPAEALSVAEADLRVMLGLLEVRHIAGDERFSVELADAARARWRSIARRRFDEVAELAEQRWARGGEVAQQAEPDLKSGHGGQRDVQLLRALALAQLVNRPGPQVVAANSLLSDTRTQLHLLAGRARDVLRAQDGDEVAVALRMSDKFELAKSLSRAGRTVVYAMSTALRGARPVRGSSRVSRRPLDDGVVLHGSGAAQEVVLARDADPGADPALVLRVAAAAATVQRPIGDATLRGLAGRSVMPPGPWPAALRDELIALLGSGPGLVDVVEAMDRTGLWGGLFPEWDRVRDLPPRAPVHHWSVDRHLVRSCVAAAALSTTVSRPDLLLLAALLHDIGKGAAGDHSVVGARLAASIGERLGLPESDVAVLAALVRHHLLLPHTATRRDVADPVTVQRVVATLRGDPVRLELLQALAEADARATGPGVWTGWQAELIADLVYRCTAAMTGTTQPEPEPLSERERTMAARAASNGRPDLLLATGSDATVVTVVAAQRSGVLAAAAGVLALHSLEVHTASVREYRGATVGVFTVSPRFGSPPDTALLQERFALTLRGRFPLAEKIAAKERDYHRAGTAQAPSHARWVAGEASGGTVLELRAPDRIGLLYRVAAAIEDCGLDVRWARASTLGVTAVDSFCLRDRGAGDEPWGGVRERILAAARP